MTKKTKKRVYVKKLKLPIDEPSQIMTCPKCGEHFPVSDGITKNKLSLAMRRQIRAFSLWWNGLSYKEIASAMNTTVGACEQLVHRFGRNHPAIKVLEKKDVIDRASRR